MSRNYHWPEPTAETLREHRARWFVYAGGYGQPLVKIPHQASMRGTWPGYDVECSCGWDSRTGGATRGSVADDLARHRADAEWAKHPDNPLNQHA